MKPIEIAETLKQSGIVPVFNHDDGTTAIRVITACYDAGLRVFEWTNRGGNAFDVFIRIASHVKEKMPDMIVGVGSVFESETARKYVARGAKFVVSPVLDPDLARTCKQMGVLWIPGTGTTTEINQASKWGAEIIKVFPGNAAGGPSFVKAVLGPMPHVQLMPTGGVSTDKENLSAWFDAGVCCVGIGSKLFTKDLVEDEDAGRLIEEIKQTINKIQDARHKILQ